MVAALLAALLLMIGHHLFYRSLDGTTVASTAFFGMDVSQQQFNTATGTAIAFLAKACLVIAISIAYFQIFWNAITTSNSKKAPTLGRIDSTYSALDNVLEMFKAKSWLKYPSLMLVAGLSWLVPIASIITPATLSVQNVQVLPRPSSQERVANVDFRSLNHLAPMPDITLPSPQTYYGPKPYYYAYGGPSDDVLRVANSVMFGGTVLPIASPGANASWQLEFRGPSLDCKDVGPSTKLSFGNTLSRYLGSSYYWRQYGYLGWYPNITSDDSEHVRIPFNMSRNNTASRLPNLGFLVPDSTHESLNRTSKTLEMMIFARSFRQWDARVPNRDPADTLLRCQLRNATYRVDFDFVGGSQKVSVAATVDLRGPGIQDVTGVLYKYMSQATDTYEYPCEQEISQDLRCCYNSPGLLENLSYQAIMDAFARNLQGSVFMDHPNDATGLSFHTNSSLMLTKLARHKDLAFLQKALQSPGAITNLPTFQTVVEANNSMITNGTSAFSADFTGTYTTILEHFALDLSLAEAIEEMFRNVTVSLMSSSALQPNYSSPSAPTPATVTYHRYHNVYSYSPRKLWLPYGIALGLSTLAVIAGLVAIAMNHASYSSNFSTVLRAAHAAKLSSEISDEDARGHDPLPRYLADSQLWLDLSGSGTAFGTVEVAGPASGHGKEARNTVRLLQGEGMRSTARQS